ncbi:methylglyoxal synthase [Veronia pacifica]|uniref:Methylglyoxal synthase n=1 Tax=Veronia pacifica TaxID=1080227 RepID=A0A1C3EB51_9GAMM|nr:methylglyoxal synthase [Veronia pacifica]ODA30459.1 methylglyoxal synthase [Veronia pacifica]
MKSTVRVIQEKKQIALVAHDNCKKHLLEWVKTHEDELSRHELYATGTTGNIISKSTSLAIHPMISGPLGGDQQLGAMISEKRIDMMVFFWDPLTSVPHDPDVKALLRISAVWNIPVAFNRASADFMIKSPLISQASEIVIPDYDAYLAERL